MSDTIRSVALDQAARHPGGDTAMGNDGEYVICAGCYDIWPCLDRVAADKYLAILDKAEMTESRVTTPSGFKVYKPARIVSDWTPSANEPAAHGWSDPVGAQPETEPA